MAGSMAVARHLRTLLGAGAMGSLTDGQLLERFATRHGEAAELAFAVLVARHGPMVLGICRRILADPHDAEDAFQATFLVLVRKASSVRVDDSLGRWLYGVACRVASRARTEALRRRAREAGVVPDRDRAANSTGDPDLRGLLDEELSRLPEKYRAPLVLCYLEGLTHERAAQQLGWPVGTVRGRLARARERLRSRLVRRGLAPLAALGIPWVGSREALAVVPASLAEATVRAAAVRLAATRMVAGPASAAVAALAHGAFQAMVLSPWKAAVAAMLVVVSVSVSTPAFLVASDHEAPGRAGPRVEAKGEPVDTNPPGEARTPQLAARAPRKPSKTEREAARLAQEAFGPGHWSAEVGLPVRYYDHQRGYWMHAKTYQLLGDGKQLRLRPFALIGKSHDGQGIQTVTSDEAIIELDQPLDLTKGVGSPIQVLHARYQGDVRLRDNRATPDDPSDDLTIGPMPSADFDVARLQIRSESDVVIQDRHMRITGSGLQIELRPGDGSDPRRDRGSLSGVKSFSLKKQVHVFIKEAKTSALLPGKVDPGQGRGGTPLELRCSGPLQVDYPGPRRPQGDGPGTRSSPARASFSGDVVVQRGTAGQALGQLNCETLEMTLWPDPAPGAADGASGMSLREVRATGHAVWIQCKSLGIKARCNELTSPKSTSKEPGAIHLRSDQGLKVHVEVQTVVNSPDQGSVPSVTTLRATEVRIGLEDGSASVMASGSVTVETRPALAEPAEGKTLWNNSALLRHLLAAPTWPLSRLIPLNGRPMLSGHEGQTLEARDRMILRFDVQ